MVALSTLPVPNVSTSTLTGSATPIAYASCTSQRSANPAATMFFATWRAMYAAERSTLGVHDNFASSQTSVPHGSTDHESSRGIDVVLGIGVQHVRGDRLLNHVL